MAHFPAGLTNKDIEQAVSTFAKEMTRRRRSSHRSQCADTPFPTLPTDPGPKTTVPAVYVSPLPPLRLIRTPTDRPFQSPQLLNYEI